MTFDVQAAKICQVSILFQEDTMQRHVLATLVIGTLWLLILFNAQEAAPAQSASPAEPLAQPSPRPTVASQPQATPNAGVVGVEGGFADPSVSEIAEPSQAQIGDVVEFILTITNWGSGYADNVVVTDPLPDGFDLVEVKATRGRVIVSGRTATIDVGAMNASEVIVVRLQARLNAKAQGATVTKTASVVAANDKVPTNNHSSIAVGLGSAAATTNPEDMPPLELPVTGASRVMYVTQRGDTLTSIATKYQTSVEAIKAANHLKSDFIAIEQVLIMPAPTVAASMVTGRPTYTVREGDNLFRIGLRFGIPWEKIAKANRIVNPLLLQWGQALVIPAGNVVPTQRAYIVKPGDTLTAIALKHKISVRALMLANQLSSSVIVTGQVLRIP
jgi:uncharacterized repeat protein (TIGR01451 family)